MDNPNSIPLKVGNVVKSMIQDDEKILKQIKLGSKFSWDAWSSGMVYITSKKIIIFMQTFKGNERGYKTGFYEKPGFHIFPYESIDSIEVKKKYMEIKWINRNSEIKKTFVNYSEEDKEGKKIMEGIKEVLKTIQI